MSETPWPADQAQRRRAAPPDRIVACQRGEIPWLPTLMATWPTPQIAQSRISSAAAAGSIAERWVTRALRLGGVEPDGRGGRRLPRREAVEESAGIRLDQEQRRVLGPDEAFLHGVPE